MRLGEAEREMVFDIVRSELVVAEGSLSRLCIALLLLIHCYTFCISCLFTNSAAYSFLV